MKKTVRLTESDLVRIVKKILNEQPPIRNIIAPLSDDLARAFGDDAARSVESALARAISKQGTNIIEKGGTLYLKSLRGTEVKVDSVKKALEAVKNGTKPIEEVIDVFPNHLADGSEFRSSFENLKLQPTPSASTKLLPGTAEYNKYHGLPSNWKGTKEGYHEKVTNKKFFGGSN